MHVSIYKSFKEPYGYCTGETVGYIAYDAICSEILLPQFQNRLNRTNPAKVLACLIDLLGYNLLYTCVLLINALTLAPSNTRL